MYLQGRRGPTLRLGESRPLSADGARAAAETTAGGIVPEGVVVNNTALILRHYCCIQLSRVSRCLLKALDDMKAEFFLAVPSIDWLPSLGLWQTEGQQ